jgi:hypothetical protein
VLPVWLNMSINNKSSSVELFACHPTLASFANLSSPILLIRIVKSCYPSRFSVRYGRNKLPVLCKHLSVTCQWRSDIDIRRCFESRADVLSSRLGDADRCSQRSDTFMGTWIDHLRCVGDDRSALLHGIDLTSRCHCTRSVLGDYQS